MRALFARGAAASKAQFSGLYSRLSLLAVFALAMAFLPGAAHADTLDTYTLAGTFNSGGTLSGTITFDWNGFSAVVKSATVVADGHTYTCSAASPCSVGNFFTTDYIDIQGHSNDLLLNFGAINFSHPPATFTLYSSSVCNDCLSRDHDDYLASGLATDPPTSPTPEPPDALLFGAGLIGIAAMASARRKEAAAVTSAAPVANLAAIS